MYLKYKLIKLYPYLICFLKVLIKYHLIICYQLIEYNNIKLYGEISANKLSENK